MKKLLVIIAVISLTLNSLAQVNFGAKAGINIASTSSGNRGDFRTAMVFGGFAKYQFSEKFAIQPELLYSMQGRGLKNYDFVSRINYLNIPVLAKYYFVKGLSLQVGPQVGFLMSAKYEGTSVDGYKKVDFKDEMNIVDFALSLGAAYDFDFGLGLDTRYNHGLSNMHKDDREYQHEVWQFTVSYTF